jgi:hypothetical protein
MNSIISIPQTPPRKRGLDTVESPLASSSDSASSSFLSPPDFLSPRPLRPSTLQGRKIFAIPSPDGRKSLSPSATASYIRTPEHPSHPFSPDKTRLKIDERIYFTFERFLLAALLGCETKRGKTKFNGSHAQVENWQAAHASLTPSLHDDLLLRIQRAVAERGFDRLTEQERNFVRHRLGVDTPTRKKEQKDRSDVQFLAAIQPWGRQARGSFAGTDKEFLRNSTIEQPTSANRLDCHFERSLRTLEDELAEKCRSNKDFTPQDAMDEFMQAYHTLATKFIASIQLRQQQFDQFLELHTRMNAHLDKLISLTPETTSEADYQKFGTDLQAYLSLKTVICQSSDGVSSFKSFITYSQPRPMYFCWGQLAKNFAANPVAEAIAYFHATKSQLQPSEFEAAKVASVKEDLSLRLQEAQAQGGKLAAIREEPPNFTKLFFGSYDAAAGKRLTPSQGDIEQQLMEGMRPLKRQKDRAPKPVAMKPVTLKFDA